MAAQAHSPTPPPQGEPRERFDPAEPFDINRYPPASPSDLRIAAAIRALAVPTPAPELWAPLLADFADRAPDRQAAHAALARRTKEATPPAPTDAAGASAWTGRGAALFGQLQTQADAFTAAAAALTARTRALAVPLPTAEQWSAAREQLRTALGARRQDSERLEKITRDEPVQPQETGAAEKQADWLALEATLRQNQHGAPPPVQAQRWDSMWQRIQGKIEPSASVTQAGGTKTETTGAPAVPPAAPAAANAADRHATLALRVVGGARAKSQPRSWGLLYTAISVAALLLVAVGLWQLHGLGGTVTPTHSGSVKPVPAQTASLTSAEILDMGDVDDSVTSVVRTTSGNHPVTVVVIVNQ